MCSRVLQRIQVRDIACFQIGGKVLESSDFWKRCTFVLGLVTVGSKGVLG